MKAVVFATGPAKEAAGHLAALSITGADLSVVAPTAIAAELRSTTGREVLDFHPLAGVSLWRRLRCFLRGSEGQVLCVSGGASYPLFKLFAFTLRGRVSFLRPEGRISLNLAAFLWLTVRRLWARQNGVLIVEAAPAPLLERIEQDVRRRRPEAEIVRLAQLGPLEFFHWVRQWRRFRYLVIPWTAQGHDFRKLAAWFLPFGRREIYNEYGESFSVRQMVVLLEHFWRRMIRLPQGVTMLGSASGYYLKDIVTDVRRRHPGEPVHGLLPPRLIKPAGPMFDSFTVWRPGSFRTWVELAQRAFGSGRAGWYVVPFTNEGFYAMKLGGLLLPLGRREIYNENHDGFLLRSPRMLIRHLHWRIYHRLFYQALTERHGRSWPVHVFHLLAYPLRLLHGAGLLFAVRLRAMWLPPAASHAPPAKIAVPTSRTQPEEVFDTAKH